MTHVFEIKIPVAGYGSPESVSIDHGRIFFSDFPSYNELLNKLDELDKEWSGDPLYEPMPTYREMIKFCKALGEESYPSEWPEDMGAQSIPFDMSYGHCSIWIVRHEAY